MHSHLAIGEVEAQSWLACMGKALEKTADEDTRRMLMQTFQRVATALRNKPEADNPLKVTSA